MADHAYLTAARAAQLVERIGVGESGKVPFGAPNRSGATVDITDVGNVLTREATDRFLLKTQWCEHVPGHGFGASWEEAETLTRDEVTQRFRYYPAPRELLAALANGTDFDWRSLYWPR
jgi:hypothetical protein